MYSLITFYFTSAGTWTLLIKDLHVPPVLISKLYLLICVALILKTNNRKWFELDLIDVIQITVYHTHSIYIGA